MELTGKLAVKAYPNYNSGSSGRNDEEQLKVVEIGKAMEKSCINCAHFTQVSQVDNGKCHYHYTRRDVHDVCPEFETPAEWGKRWRDSH